MYQLINRIALKFIYRSEFNVKVGRKLFYNDGGIVSNIIGRYVKKRDSKNSKKLDFHCDQSPFVEDLKDSGSPSVFVKSMGDFFIYYFLINAC